MSIIAKVLDKGTAKWGYAQREFEPPLGIPMGGHAATGQVGNSRNSGDALHMRTLVLNPGADDELVICFMDLHTGTVALWDAVYKALPNGHHRRIALVGSHTHYGPGKYYGNSFYDALAQKETGDFPLIKPIQSLIDLMAAAIVSSIADAKANAKPGRVAIMQSKHWKSGANRSYEAFERNGDLATAWTNSDMPGGGVESGIDELYKAIDPRVTTILAVDDDQKHICSFSTVACHSTCMGPYQEAYSADWPGAAAAFVKKTLEAQHPAGDVKYDAAFAMSNGGDVSSLELQKLKEGGGKDAGQGNGLRNSRGMEIGKHIVEAINLRLGEVRQGTLGPIAISYKSDEWLEKEDRFKPEDEFGPPKPGWPVVAGAEDGHGRRDLTEAREGILDPDSVGSHTDLNQYPKRIAFEYVLNLLNLSGDILKLAERHPLCQIRIGSHIMLSAPCELTTVAGYWLTEIVAQQAGPGTTASVLANTNDYIGYITSPLEYDAQHYEGGQTLFGVGSLDLLVDTHLLILAASTPPVTPPVDGPAIAGGPVVEAAAGPVVDAAGTSIDPSESIRSRRAEILSQVNDGGFVHVERPSVSRSAPAPEPTEKQKQRRARMSALSDRFARAAGRSREIKTVEVEAVEIPKYQVQVLFRTEQPRETVYLRYQGDTYQSKDVTNFGNIGGEDADVYAAVFVFTGEPAQREQYELVLDQ